MSYILDALRRAESERERERGGVPGLNAQSLPVDSLDARDSRRSRVWMWVAIGVTLGLAVPLAWRVLGSDDAASGEAVATGVRAPVSGNVLAPTPQATLPTTPAAPAPAPAMAAPGAQPPAPAVAAAPPAVAAPPGAAPPIRSAPRAVAARASAAGGRAAIAGASAPERTASPRQPPPSPAPRGAAPVAAAPAAPVSRLAELPEDVRREVPTLAFGGSIYSELPAQRMVILNGQVLREGDPITGELAVDEIRPKSAVLRIKGRRFEMVF